MKGEGAPEGWRRARYGRDWNEIHLAEDPAVAFLRKLGFVYVGPEALEKERASLKETVLSGRLQNALQKLNPWLSPESAQRGVKAITQHPAAGLQEANERLYTTLTYGISVEQDLGPGKTSHSVRFFDFEHPENNELIVTRQYKVLGSKKHIIPDVVLLVNGIPLVVIECKSPTIGSTWRDEATKQLRRYQEADATWRGQGAPKLFETVQLLIATCGQGACYGTVGTPGRFFFEWKEPHPLTLAQLEELLGHQPTAQDVLLFGLCHPKNLLDLVRNFVVFDTETGRSVRKACRYKQFIAVNRAIDRIKSARKPGDRGGVVWHTQGSGKSLTMLWLALKLRRDPAFQNPTLVIVTDRRDLDRQISGTFRNCGFPNPEQANSVRDLRALLSGPPGKTITTTVQKFLELTTANGGGDQRTKREAHPTLSEASNVFVMVDEAHRTQYKNLAANMRAALPNACFLGFTGTPIDKKDKSTLSTFGPYIDTYTIEQAVADGATVPIFYEGRLPELRIIGQTLDQLFDRVFADRSKDEREEIKKRYGNERAIAGAPKRIEAIVLDLLEHFSKFIQPNGFKAQVVAVDRETAVGYFKTLQKLNGPESAVIISGGHNDPLAEWALDRDRQAVLIERFKDPADPLSILVVCDMLLTGFDAPVEQVMYLDSPLKEHTLLQAIARVNRTADKKDYGLVIDYWGISQDLQDALKIFTSTDVEAALAPKVDELPRLETRHAAVLRFFAKVKSKDDLHECVSALEAEDVRAEFDLAFRRFSQSMDMMLPDTRALRFNDDLRWIGKIRQAAKARFHDPKLDISECGAKVKQLIEEAIIAEGVQILVKEVPLFSAEFEEKLERLTTPEAKASEMEHAIRHEIHVHLEENPAFYESLRERLQKIIDDRRAERLSAVEQLKLFQELRKEAQAPHEAAKQVGLDETGFAIYGLLERARPSSVARDGDAAGLGGANKDLASLIGEAIEPLTEIVDWVQKEDVHRQMRQKIKRQLRATGMTGEDVEGLAQSIVDLAKVRSGR